MKRATCFLSVALALIPAVANAGCPATFIFGTWQAYIDQTDIAPAASYWTRCRMVTRATAGNAPWGMVEDGFCKNAYNATLPLEGGPISQIAVNSCGFTMQFTIKGTIYTVTHATMSKDGLTAAGAGHYDTGTFTIAMVKG